MPLLPWCQNCHFFYSLTTFLVRLQYCCEYLSCQWVEYGKWLINTIFIVILGWSTNRRTDCWVQGSFLLIRQGWWRYYYYKGVGYSHEITRSKPYWSRTPGHDQWSWCWWYIFHNFLFLCKLHFQKISTVCYCRFNNPLHSAVIILYHTICLG